MSTVEESPCPQCNAPPGSLSLSERLVAKPLGTHSLSGSQMKVTAIARPFLACSVCGLLIAGVYDRDGRHVSFQPPKGKIP